MPPNPARPENEEILAAVQALQGGAGQDAFAPIFRHFYPPLHKFFANRPALREEADDLAQTTLIRALQKIHQYAYDLSFEAWIRKIGENVWNNAVRERLALKRGPLHDSLELPVDEQGDVEPASPRGRLPSDEAPNPEEAALNDERTRVLKSALETLPMGMRRCLELQIFSELKYREIAEIMGIGVHSVGSQIFEARKRLQPILDEYFQGADF